MVWEEADKSTGLPLSGKKGRVVGSGAYLDPVIHPVFTGKVLSWGETRVLIQR